MKSIITTAALALSLVFAADISHADKYRCTVQAGCSARIVSGGQQYEFTFSKDDIVDTSAGWIVNSSDGWVVV